MTRKRTTALPQEAGVERIGNRTGEDTRADAMLPAKIMQATHAVQAELPHEPIAQPKPQRSNGREHHRREVYVRRMTNNDMPRAIEWWKRLQDDNHFDEKVIAYPATAMMCAYDKQAGPLLYVPVQQAWLIDALGPNPLASELDMAEALKQLIKALHYEAHKTGVGEIYFPCTDPDATKVALAHGFEPLRMLMLRLRVL